MIGRSAAELERRDKILGAALVLVASAGTLIAAANGPAALAVAVAAVGLGAALLGVAVKVQRGRAEEMEEREAEWRLPLLRMREIVARGLSYELGVDPEAPDSLALLGLAAEEHPEYVRRWADGKIRDRLREAAADGGASLVVVSGPSKAGKSRTLLEAAHRALENAWVLSPNTAEAVAKLAHSRPPRRVGSGPCMVWLDDIETLAHGERGLNAQTMRAFGEWGLPVVLLATQGGKGIELGGDSARQFREVVADLLTRYPPISLEPSLADSELEEVRDRYPDVASRIAAEGLGEFMIAAPRLLDRLRNGDSAAGKAVAWAAIDFQRAGLLRPSSRAQLEELYGHYLAGAPGAERFAAGLEWAADPLYSTVALIGRPEGSLDEYKPHDYLVDWARQQRREIDGAAWDTMLSSYADGADELLRMGTVAHQYGETDRAEWAWQRADALGSGTAAANLGQLCEDRGDLEGAERAYRRADERGDGYGAGVLGQLLEAQGDIEGAKAAFQRADDRGEAQGACWNGYFLHTRLEDLEGAEAAFRRAIARGHWHGASQLGRLLEDHGDLDGAKAAFRQADEHGDASGARRLGLRLELSDDLGGAEAAYRRADERGDGYAAGKLGWLLELRGEFEEGREAYRRGERRGDAWTASQLAGIMQREGDEEGAEAVYRRLHERGEAVGSFYLGLMLWHRGEMEEAEAVYRSGPDDERSIARSLGRLLKSKGDLDGAEAALRRAGDLGDSLALLHLVELLEERRVGADEDDGEVERVAAACEKVAIQADRYGDSEASYVLGRLRLRRGELDDAEVALYRADKRGNSDGTARLAWVLVHERGKKAEGLALYERADDLGDRHAPYYVGLLRRRRGDRVDALEAFVRADARGSAPGSYELARTLFEEADGPELRQRAMEIYERALERAINNGHDDLAAQVSEEIQRARQLQP